MKKKIKCKSDIKWLRKIKRWPIRKPSWMPIILSPVDFAFIEHSKTISDEIYNALGVPKELMADYGKPYKNVGIWIKSADGAFKLENITNT